MKRAPAHHTTELKKIVSGVLHEVFSLQGRRRDAVTDEHMTLETLEPRLS